MEHTAQVKEHVAVNTTGTAQKMEIKCQIGSIVT